MTKTELRNNFQAQLSKELFQYNFKLNKQTSEFTREKKYGWDKFQLVFINMGSRWEVNFGLLMRIDMIENIYHEGLYYESKYHKTTPTIGITIEKYINDGNEYRLYIDTNSELDSCTDKVLQLFKSIALPFFEKYESIQKLDEAINVELGSSIFSGIKYGGNLGIILAKLNNNPSFGILENKYREYYKIFCNGFYLEEFENILKVVKKIH